MAGLDGGCPARVAGRAIGRQGASQSATPSNILQTPLCTPSKNLCTLSNIPCTSHWQVDVVWYQLTAVLNFGIFNGPKKNSNSTQFIQGFQNR